MLQNFFVNFWIASILAGSASHTDTTLSGSVSHTEGKSPVGLIGIKYNWIKCTVLRVMRNSPAEGVLHVGDKILYPTGSGLDGKANEVVILTVKRNDQIIQIEIVRAPSDSFKHDDYVE